MNYTFNNRARALYGMESIGERIENKSQQCIGGGWVCVCVSCFIFFQFRVVYNQQTYYNNMKTITKMHSNWMDLYIEHEWNQWIECDFHRFSISNQWKVYVLKWKCMIFTIGTWCELEQRNTFALSFRVYVFISIEYSKLILFLISLDIFIAHSKKFVR